MKIDANSSLYTVQEVKSQVQHTELNKEITTTAQAKQSVDINMHDQNLIAQSSAELKSMPEVDLDLVAQIKQQIAQGDIQFDMGELANALVG